MAATRSLLKSHSNLASQFLRKPLYLTTPIARSTIIDEALSFPLSQKSQHPPPSPVFFLSDFLGANQKLLVGEQGFLSVHQCLQTGHSAVGGSLLTRGRGGSSSSRKQIDSGKEFDDDNVDEFDDGDDDFPEDLDDQDFDGEFSEDFDDDEIDSKPKRKK